MLISCEEKGKSFFGLKEKGPSSSMGSDVESWDFSYLLSMCSWTFRWGNDEADVKAVRLIWQKTISFINKCIWFIFHLHTLSWTCDSCIDFWGNLWASMCPTKMWIASNKIKVSCLHVLHMLHMSFTKSRVILVTTSDFDLVWYLQIGEMASWNPTELSMLGVVSPSDVFWPPQMIMDTIPTNKWFKPCIFTGGRLMGSKFSQPFFGKSPNGWVSSGSLVSKWLRLCVFFYCEDGGGFWSFIL